MTLYVESSALLGVLIEADSGLADHFRSAPSRAASKLTLTIL